MKKGFAPIILIAVLALVIAVGGVGIGLAWKTNRLDKWLPPNIKEMFGRGEKPEEEPGEEPEEKPEEEPETKPEEDLTKDWKTYTSSDSGYAIKYPPNLYIEGPSCLAVPAPEEGCEHIIISNLEEMAINVALLEGETIHLWVLADKDPGKTLDQRLSELTGPAGQVSNVERFKIDGTEARKFLLIYPEDPSGYPPTEKYIVTVAIKNDWVYTVKGTSFTSVTDDPYNSDNYKTMWKMMSTFKFIE